MQFEILSIEENDFSFYCLSTDWAFSDLISAKLTCAVSTQEDAVLTTIHAHLTLCLCVCVCVSERVSEGRSERERERETDLVLHLLKLLL